MRLNPFDDRADGIQAIYRARRMETAFQLDSSLFSLFRDRPVSKPPPDPVKRTVNVFKTNVQEPKVHLGYVKAEFRYEANWAVVDLLVGVCKNGSQQEYASDSAGPDSGDAYLSRHGCRWLASDES